MSIGEIDSDRNETHDEALTPLSDSSDALDMLPSDSGGRALHRLGEVRRQQNVSRRNVARHLNADMDTIRAQENPASDLPLSVLYQWQEVLDVPVTSLLVDSDEQLSSPVEHRAKLVRVMKTAAAILERAEGARMRRLAQMLVEQLIELMPELKDVGAWNAVGRRRNQDDFGRIMESPVPDDLFGNAHDR